MEIQEAEGDLKTINGYFPGRRRVEALKRRLQALAENLQELFPQIPKASYRVSVLPDRDWQAKWKRGLRPLRISVDLVIQPSWWRTKQPARPGMTVLKIDPKTAFGTGHHPTTRLCLLALKELVKPGYRVLDYGCGSGILGIFAARIGAALVLGIDNDLGALRCAQENVVENRVGDIVKIRIQPRPLKRDFFDLAVANIDFVSLTGLIPRIVGAVQKGGLILVSGILTEESRPMRKILNQAGIRILKTYRDGEWIVILGKKR